MKTYKWVIIAINLLLLLGYFHYSVASKEKILDKGTLILLELAPVDPRSLMQGDYMLLRYKIADAARDTTMDRRGYCVVKLLPGKVAQHVRFQPTRSPLAADEHLLAYTSPNKWQIELGAESYFFQEGHAEKYDSARYGGLMIDEQGNSLLVGLYDQHLKKIE